MAKPAASKGTPFAKIANAKDVAKAADGVTQIVKFHGDFNDDASLVLAETDYVERLKFDSPLDIKFRVDVLGAPRAGACRGEAAPESEDLSNLVATLSREWQAWIDRRGSSSGKRTESWQGQCGHAIGGILIELIGSKF